MVYRFMSCLLLTTNLQNLTQCAKEIPVFFRATTASGSKENAKKTRGSESECARGEVQYGLQVQLQRLL